ncbi:MAG: potassium channel protein [Polyangia bacterium]
MLKALSAVVFAIAVGTIGFWVVTGDEVPLHDCFYMTIITLSTVGYGEVIPLDLAGRIFASVLIVFGMGSLIYFGSTVIALWVEIDLQQARRRRRMKKALDSIADHVIVCGVGTTGSRVVQELIETETPFVMIDTQEERLETLVQNAGDRNDPIPHVVGDATEDRVLHEAGIERAKGLVAALRNDKDNLYLILSARQLNPDLRIVARATETEAPPKMLRAGADRVVAPNLIGGMRIASEMIRPDVVEFLDVMLKDKEQSTRIEQVDLPEGSPLEGRRLSETRIREATDVLVIALRDKRGRFIYNPGPETELTRGATLVVLGSQESVIKLRRSLSGSTQVITG